MKKNNYNNQTKWISYPADLYLLYTMYFTDTFELPMIFLPQNTSIIATKENSH